MCDNYTIEAATPKAVAEAAVKRLIEAQLSCQGAEHAVKAALLHFGRSLAPKGIREGDTVSVAFVDGTEDCIYDGIEATCGMVEYGMMPRAYVKLRHFARKGHKLHKHPTSYDLGMLQWITSKEPSNV